MSRATLWSVLLVLLTAVAAASADAQVLRGRVVDAESEVGIPQANVEVLSGTTVMARALTNVDGWFEVRVRDAGRYVIRAAAFGYPASESAEVQLEAREMIEMTVRIAPVPIALEMITVNARERDPRHAATLEGLFTRHSTTPRVGPSRVVLRTDYEMAAAMTVRDVLRHFRAPNRCVHYYVDGRPSQGLAAFVLEMPADWVEGIEFYRNGNLAPIDYWGAMCPGQRGNSFSVIAIWHRRR